MGLGQRIRLELYTSDIGWMMLLSPLGFALGLNTLDCQESVLTVILAA